MRLLHRDGCYLLLLALLGAQSRIEIVWMGV
jgi:hypothetical protein